MAKKKPRTCRRCKIPFTPTGRERTCPACKAAKRQAKPHTTREAKNVRRPDPGHLVTREVHRVVTRATHPQFYWNVERHGPRPGEWLGVRPGYPCDSCDRILNNNYSQAVICTGTSGTGEIAYLICRVCYHRWKMPVARR